jgi:hypothetical protein
MSYTEIYEFNKNGKIINVSEIQNAWRGAMAIWGIIEKKYLKPLPKPIWMLDRDYNTRGYSRCDMIYTGNDSPMHEIWNCFDSDEISEIDRIVLGTTFDNILVKYKNINRVIDAFIKFEGETSLKEQAEILRKINPEDRIYAIGWNQTSVCEGWRNFKSNKKRNFLFDDHVFNK